MNKSRNIIISLSSVQKAEELIEFLDNEAIEYDYISALPLTQSRVVAKAGKYITRVSLLAGLIGFIAAIFLQYWAGTINYPMNIGNKPFFSLPTSLPIAFETAILFAGVAAFAAFIFKQNSKPVSNLSEQSKQITLIVDLKYYDKLSCICQQLNIEFEEFETED